MSVMSWIHHVPTPPSQGDEGPLSPRDEEKARALGLTSATGLVVGSIIGTGVFTMPAVLACPIERDPAWKQARSTA